MTLPGVTEHDHQVLLVKWLRARGVECFAVPNEQGGSGQYRRANWLKAQGKLRGAPDLILMDLARVPPAVPEVVRRHDRSPRHWAPVAIEMKRAKGVELRAEQEGVKLELRRRGWIVLTPRGYADAVAQLEGLGF